MELQIFYNASNVEVSFERKADDVIFHLRPAMVDGLLLTDSRFMNPYSTRKIFLGIQSPAEALDFLALTGFFRYPEKLDSNLDRSLRWSEFKLWQEAIRLRMTASHSSAVEKFEELAEVTWDTLPRFKPILSNLEARESSWLYDCGDFSISKRLSMSNPRRVELHAFTTVLSTLEAILATIYIDDLNGINYGICKLSDCSNVFEITSRHKKEYCSQACAHKASLRKRRQQSQMSPVTSGRSEAQNEPKARK